MWQLDRRSWACRACSTQNWPSRMKCRTCNKPVASDCKKNSLCHIRRHSNIDRSSLARLPHCKVVVATMVEASWCDVSWGRMANMSHLRERNGRSNILTNQKQRIRWFNHRKAARKQQECAITAPLTIASAAPSTWEAPDPSEVPLPRVTEARCGFHKPGYFRKWDEGTSAF